MLTIGVCALQGAFVEHIQVLKRLSDNRFNVIEVRTTTELHSCHALVIPGGESTAMRIIGENHGFVDELKTFVRTGKPIWGTCAGCILLSDETVQTHGGGLLPGSSAHLAELPATPGILGGVDITTSRNYFGRQAQSFVKSLEALSSTPAALASAFHQFPAVFIRAPAILKVGPKATAIAKVDDVVVAVVQGTKFVTCFHPELTQDLRIHAAFLELVTSFYLKEEQL